MVQAMSLTTFLGRRSKRWQHLANVPVRRLAPLLIAVFLLFSTIGFFYDLIDGGVIPYAVVLTNAVFSGIQAVAWLLAFARLPIIYIYGMGVIQLLLIFATPGYWVRIAFHLSPVSEVTGIHFSAYGTLIATVTSYAFFVVYIRTAGREAERLKAELDLAHSIQKTLVPVISMSTQAFEIYGISQPSDKVGGDLVDAVEIVGGDTIVYLADIAGHGLQAGILMGMLKTAARTALLDGAGYEQGAILSMLMERLNKVLPGVKEAHMYATFTALRLNLNGQAFYGMAASPPLLVWSATRKSILRIEREQFPLALLPVSGFPAYPFAMGLGDLALIATDGIIEVCSQGGVEFGIDALEALLSEEAALPLHVLAAAIFKTVRAYGRQVDDQTLLLVRRLSS
jgi:hypothetical protein